MIDAACSFPPTLVKALPVSASPSANPQTMHVRSVWQHTRAGRGAGRDGLAAVAAKFALDRRSAQRGMPHGAIRSREMHDKLGYFELTAIAAPARSALERYLRQYPRLGSAPLFPDSKRPEQCIPKIAADYCCAVPSWPPSSRSSTAGSGTATVAHGRAHGSTFRTSTSRAPAAGGT
jgi:hypothetical protein